MFRFLKSRTGKKRSTLDKQRVKGNAASKSTPGHVFSWSLAAKGLLGVAGLILVWGLSIRIFDKAVDVASYVNSLVVLPPHEWRIDVLSSGGAPLPEDVRREVYKIASKQLRQGSPAELSTLAKQVEGLGMLDGVKVIRPLADTVILSAEIRRPALLVSVGAKTRFLSLDGTVFGDSADNSGNPSGSLPTVLVTGIFDGRPNPAVDSSLRIIVTPEERRHLSEAIEIWQRSVESGVDVRSVGFQKFRGYAITLNDETEIVIGIKPFDYKLKKLRGILDGLKKDGVVASRIELDYEGKAFIKERKL